jgi:hypothetical protein
MSANDVEHTGIPLARIARLSHGEGRTLKIEWAEGERAGIVENVDLTPAINSFKIYRPLRNDAALFATARLVENGDVIAWDGPDLEMTAEMVADLASQMMTAQDLQNFLERTKLTQEALAGILGYSRRQIAYYLSGHPIPRVFYYACKGYEADEFMKRIRQQPNVSYAPHQGVLRATAHVA